MPGFERGVGEKRSQRVGVVDCVRVRRILQEIGCGADQFVEVFETLSPVLFRQVVLTQATLLDEVVNDFR